jgi:hypothetical protein
MMVVCVAKHIGAVISAVHRVKDKTFFDRSR